MMEYVLLISLVIVGVHNAFQQGNILFPLRQQTEYYTPMWLRKPLYGCLPCMASVTGITSWFILDFRYGFLILSIPAISGLMVLIEKLFKDDSDDSGMATG